MFEEIIDSFFYEIKKEIELLISYSVQNNAIPSLKGFPTRGKMKWRGIYLINKNDGSDTLMWVQQRGKRISPVLRISYGKIENGNLTNLTIDKFEPPQEYYINFEIKNYGRKRVQSNKRA